MQIKLTDLAKSAGCAAKLGQADLKAVLSKLPYGLDKNLLIGHASYDDAAVYKLRDDLALVETVDIFPPVVDDPFDYGRIAAANALSDIYAMGATPISALSFVAWPLDKLGIEPLQQVISGASQVCSEAKIVIGGGHSIFDNEPKFGLFVNGTVHPEKIISNDSARVGDALILTKKIGTGIVTTAAKRGFLERKQIQEIVSSMATLNSSAAQVMIDHSLKCGTDITGFGLLGHLGNMLKSSSHKSANKLGARISFDSIPFFNLAKEFLDKGVCPEGTRRNLDYVIGNLKFERQITNMEKLLISDAQTSGGLLMTVPKLESTDVLADLHASGMLSSAVIGEVVDSRDPGTITII